MMWRLNLAGQTYDLRVLAGLVLISVVLGILNNMRVYEEQQIPWSGVDSESEEGVSAE